MDRRDGRNGTVAARRGWARRTGWVALALFGTWGTAQAQDNPPSAPPALDAQQARGQYLAALGDCVSCHTAPGGGDFAGGRGLATPFGTVYTTNITPDTETGIGGWTDDQFYRAMHEGIAADGSHLYPAFPYPWFTKLTRDDVDAIHAYLKTLPPVKNKAPDNKLMGPLNFRASVIGWNALYFTAGSFVPDGSKSAAWNRGAYLVEGAGHCGACHTPLNIAGAADSSKAYQGGELEHWFAPNLTGDVRTGLGAWTAEDIAQYLKTGQGDRSDAYGPMNEVVQNSTSKLTDADLAAIATYLKSIPAAGPAPSTDRPAADIVQAGQALYAGSCASCHGGDGAGGSGLFPSLKGSNLVQSDNPTTVIRLVLGGDSADTTDQAMPAFADKFSDTEAAAVLSYIRSAWGNAAPPVAASDVKKIRDVISTAGGQ